MTLLLVLVGGAVGAPARYLVDQLVTARTGGRMPWGTFTVNVVGSLVLGVVVGAVTASGGPDWLTTLVGTGFCGALTTFSTFSAETVRLVEEGRTTSAAAYVGFSVVVGLAACVGGCAAGHAVAAALG